MSVGGKSFGPWNGGRHCPREGPHLSSLLIEFDQGVGVVASDQQMPLPNSIRPLGPQPSLFQYRRTLLPSHDSISFPAYST